MINHVQFPGLGLEFTVNRVAFTVFGLDIYWYGIIVTSAIAVGVILSTYLAKKIGLDTDKYTDLLMVCAFVAIVCARIYYIVFAPFKYNSLKDMINLRDGGLAIYGGILGGFACAFIVAKIKKLNFADCFDCASAIFPLGQAIGRWGNFVNQEAFGTNTTGILGMISESTTSYLLRVQSSLRAQGIIVDPFAPVHPTFLYESLWNLVGFAILFPYFKHRKFKGEIFCMYIAWYGLGRFFIEGMRTDSLEIIPGLRASQLLAAVMFVIGVSIIVIMRKRGKVKNV